MPVVNTVLFHPRAYQLDTLGLTGLGLAISGATSFRLLAGMPVVCDRCQTSVQVEGSATSRIATISFGDVCIQHSI